MHISNIFALQLTERNRERDIGKEREIVPIHISKIQNDIALFHLGLQYLEFTRQECMFGAVTYGDHFPISRLRAKNRDY